MGQGETGHDVGSVYCTPTLKALRTWYENIIAQHEVLGNEVHASALSVFVHTLLVDRVYGSQSLI